MTTPSKRKGSQYERDVVKWLISMGYPCAERAYGAGRHDDVGDLVVDARAQEDDALLEQQGVDVVRALAAAASLDNHRNQRLR